MTEEFPPPLPHGELREVFPGVFFLSGMMKTVLMDAPWQFSRNMTVVRDGDALTVINSIRLDDRGTEALERLGRVTHLARICALHGRDDAYYKARYGATLWSIPGVPHAHGLVPDRELVPGGEMPFRGCSLFDFRSTRHPEAIIRIDREGGILVSGDTLQNWVGPDAYFSEESRELMSNMGFFRDTNIGPLWMQLNDPQPDDFRRLKDLSFRHVLPAHGEPVIDTARSAFTATFERLFGI